MSASAGSQTLRAVVTGGASGIGEATVRKFASSGWKVIIADINADRGREIAGELSVRGFDVQSVYLDVTDEAAVQSFSEQVFSLEGGVAALINSGGILQNATRLTSMRIEDFDRILDVNLRGSVLTGKAFGKKMAESGHGAIINLCSLTTFHALPQPAYAMSKAALKTLTEVMAAELGPQGVRVNAVAPGYTLTPAMKDRIDRGERDPSKVISKSALGRFVEPSEIGEAIFFLCSPAAAAITGVTLPVDCGWLVYSVYTNAAAQPA
ncbi:NAD(P)-dependent dehydrogenase (short-subunit alcohol dehydrogenase family) [Sinorhizobium kostiense]|uniref:NAD(P)-dependent dehydrogenase (Short-subunit alcohol dehydrogenase family) n=1 Tax=Sinorhizobium kostiense TaxID=76747 RepID=A0ABS4R0Q3_9HYPH|nr:MULTISPECIES: SDR family oxidoreductase [Sinorhizobium]MBP2236482.1 NAD(P)-dependent dehydrogenase (short-subunit alcohol dehydrogenase family) [Sinorhizobium kostiense]